MDTEQEYLTIDEAAKLIGWNRATIYDWMRTLGMEKHRFVRNAHTFIHINDVRRLQEIKAKPWLAGRNEAKRQRNITEKTKKGLVSQKSIDDTRATIKSQKPATDNTLASLPTGTVSSSDFASQCSLEYNNLKNYLRRGIEGDKLEYEIIPHPTRAGYGRMFLTPSQQEKALEILRRHGKINIRADIFADMHRVPRDAFENHMLYGLGPGLIGTSTDMMAERDHVQYTKRGKEKFLTSDQQLAAIQFWKRHKLDYSKCDQQDCPCHT